ncbi:MAG: hypothetical protein ACM3XM_20660, partial [Mycobacterium leprae]
VNGSSFGADRKTTPERVIQKRAVTKVVQPGSDIQMLKRRLNDEKDRRSIGRRPRRAAAATQAGPPSRTGMIGSLQT